MSDKKIFHKEDANSVDKDLDLNSDIITKDFSFDCAHECSQCCGCQISEDNHHDEHGHEHSHGDGCCCGEEETFSVKTKFILIAVSSVLLIAAMILSSFDINLFITLPLYIAAYLVVGINCFKGCINEIREGNIFSEYLLMTVATVGAFIISEYNEAVLVMIFHCIGTIIEYYSVSRSKNSVRALLDSRPKTVEVQRDGNWQKFNVSDVKVGDIIRVKPGEMIALDGVIVKGTASIDTSSITGESVKRTFSEKDTVMSGYINLDGMLEIEISSEEKNSTLAEIIRLVEEGNKNKSNAEKTFSVFAKYYTPAVMAAALIVALICPLIWGNWSYFFGVAMLFLVASCPCSLIIGIPLSFYCSIGGMAKNGILVKGGAHIENFSRLKVMAFDKTGTLTTGDFGILKISSKNDEELLQLLSAAEYYSTHPLAQVFKKNTVNENEITDFKEISGRGVSVLFKNKKILAGNRTLLESENIEVPEIENINGSVIFVSYGGEYKGYAVLGDVVREDAEETLFKIKKSGVEKTVLLTGDGKTNATSLAKKLNIDSVFYSLLPQNKVERVEELSVEYNNRVAFVGDGINDAPVLAKAPLSVSVAGQGKDIAASSSDVVLLNGKLSGISRLISFAKKTMRLVRFDIIVSLVMKFGIMVWGFFGCPMYMAVFADVGLVIIFPLLAFALFRSSNKIK